MINHIQHTNFVFIQQLCPNEKLMYHIEISDCLTICIWHQYRYAFSTQVDTVQTHIENWNQEIFFKLKVDEFKDICDVQESEDPYGYLVTPDYPRMLQGELSCPCTLHVEKGYNIKLEVIDFRIGSCTQTGLTIWSDSYASTHCATISNDSVLPGGQNISMRLHSQTEKSNSGFLIKYYGLHCFLYCIYLI